VLKRGVERLLFNYVAGEAVDMGIKRIHGIYLPTEKNGLVRDHYGSLGFTRMEGGEGEESRWSMNMADFIPLTTTIKLTEDY
jgi:predicted enzyme involved in methoxymalonyl-ACP biosynthesis